MTTTTEDEILGELRSMVDNDGAVRGFLWDRLLTWCGRAAVDMLSPRSKGLTQCGWEALKMLLLLMSNHHEVLSAGLCDWLHENVLPGLYPEGLSKAEHELSYQLLDTLLRHYRPSATPLE